VRERDESLSVKAKGWGVSVGLLSINLEGTRKKIGSCTVVSNIHSRPIILHRRSTEDIFRPPGSSSVRYLSRILGSDSDVCHARLCSSGRGNGWGG